MDWNRIEGNWKQTKGKVKEKWGKLTDDDLTQVNGRRDQLEGQDSGALRPCQGSGPQGRGRLAQHAAVIARNEAMRMASGNLLLAISP